MNGSEPVPIEGTPTVEVRIYRDGELVDTELYETIEEADAATEHWGDVEGVTFEVNDLSNRHRPGDVLAVDPEDLGDGDAYEHDVE